ncbi:hypothetical protein DERP_002164, partial [Dermatophagoides pteronyssinus]
KFTVTVTVQNNNNKDDNNDKSTLIRIKKILSKFSVNIIKELHKQQASCIVLEFFQHYGIAYPFLFFVIMFINGKKRIYLNNNNNNQSHKCVMSCRKKTTLSSCKILCFINFFEEEEKNRWIRWNLVVCLSITFICDSILDGDLNSNL